MSMNGKKIKKIFGITTAAVGTAFVGLKVIANVKKGSSVSGSQQQD